VDWSNLKADYERLGSLTAVAREYGVTKGYVSQQAKKQGISPQPEGRSLKIDWSGLPALYESGMNFDQLAAHYGCSVHAIQNAVKRLDVKARPKGLPEGYEWTPQRRQAHHEATHTPEFRAKSRENLLKRLPTMRGPSANSPLERLLQAALIKAGISFSTQRVLIGRYCVDILLQQAPVILEADGALHHLRKAQDAERDANLTAAGYRVFRFSGTRINDNSEQCVAEVVEACGLVADTEPVFDIRTGISGSDSNFWTGGPVTVTCGQCGAETKRNAFRTKQEKMFCNAKCYGKWMAAHPEASNRRLRIDWSELPALYAGGVPLADLMQRYDCGKNTIYRQLKRMGVEELRRPPQPPKISKFSDEHRARLREGWEKRRRNGLALRQREDGRFVAADTLTPDNDTVRSGQ
jgi:very-short-patch-repair endonuclease